MQTIFFKKGLIFLLISLLVSTTVVSSFNCSIIKQSESMNRGNWLYVGGSGPGNYSTIQSAIDASFSGDTVFVFDDSAPYYEKIEINKKINLIGEDKYTTIIDGNGSGDVVLVFADWVNISSFTIRNGGKYNGISIHSNYNNITGNILTSNKYNGIGLFPYSNNNYIGKNVISKNIWGIYLTTSSNNIVTCNTITNNSNAGIRITDSSNNNLIIGNNFLSTFTNHGHLVILNSSYNTIKHNNFLRLLGWQANFGYYSKSNMCNNWNKNYWNRPRLLPKPIFGFISVETEVGSVLIPWIQFDWHPAKKRFELSTPQECGKK